MDQIEDLLISLQSSRIDRFVQRRIPDAVDDDVRRLVGCIENADCKARDVLLSMMNETHGFVLVGFAERMAALAVRSGNPQFVQEGLRAAAFASRLLYWKETIPVLSLLYHSLKKLGLEPASFFAEAAGLGDDLFDANLRRFPSRSEQDLALEAMRYTESADQDGFRYARIER